MTITLVLVGASLLAAIIGHHTKRKIYTILLFSIVAVFLALRSYETGADTWNYVRTYSLYPQYSLSYLMQETGLEWGFLLLNNGLYFISHDPRLLIAVTSLFCAFAYAFFFYRNAHDLYLAFWGYLAFGLFSFNLTGIRQSLAMAVCMFAYEMIKQKKLIWFLLLVLVASSFHTSAFVFLLAYPLGRLPVSRKNTLIISAGGLVSLIFIKPLMEMIMGVSDRYEKYGIESTSNGYIFLIIVALITFLVELFKYRMIEEDANLSLFIQINYINMFLWIARLITRTAERPSLYFMPATIVLLTALLPVMSKKNEKALVYTLVLFCMIGLFAYRFLPLNYQFL